MKQNLLRMIHGCGFAARPLVFESGTFYIIKPWQDLFVKLRFSLAKMPVAFSLRWRNAARNLQKFVPAVCGTMNF